MRWKGQVYSMPSWDGKHDKEEILRSCSTGRKNLRSYRSLSNDEWFLFGLDSVVKGEDYGNMTNGEILRLRSAFLNSEGRSIALFLHHHPVSVGTSLVIFVSLIMLMCFLNCVASIRYVLLELVMRIRCVNSSLVIPWCQFLPHCAHNG